MKLHAPVHPGSVRVECVGSEVPPGYDQILHAAAPRAWTGAVPRLVLRAPLQLVDLRSGVRGVGFERHLVVRLQLRNPGPRALRVLAGLDFPVS